MNNHQPTVKMYDALAPYYREYARKKAAYLNSVDRFVLDHIPDDAESLLDIGAGDGIRGMALAAHKNINYTVLSDISPEMIARCRELRPSDVWQAAMENLPYTDRRFDVIICLWNVLGHLDDRSNRVAALKEMRRLLSKQGSIFLDVNNRHNASAYGWLRVFGRIFLDALYPDDKRGDSSFDWEIGNESIPGMGHLFTPAEIEAIIKASGLSIQSKVAVDYHNGSQSALLLKGQLLYQLKTRREQQNELGPCLGKYLS
ncbi:MAG TPA: class I SAM-dependent methyltransferase [Firmicutes bacterium]|jgi:ubiquinone/menaquinone biosynthesis C-methylase UbiE|nr:class I SAM-dependent methyltransferase [Bacillota bacterium]